MQMDDRKWTIMKAIIKTYLETGEPVGSRTISKYPDLNLSSATIRNEMSDLEEMGYILQPHTSAGRIPSDAGYRLYVDRMMEEKDREVTEIKELMIQRQDKMELLLKRVAKVLAMNTNYATMISGPQYHRTKLKFIQLSLISENQILAVIVAEGNVVKNKMINIEHGLDQETVLRLNILLNSSLNGLRWVTRPAMQYCNTSRKMCSKKMIPIIEMNTLSTCHAWPVWLISRKMPKM